MYIHIHAQMHTDPYTYIHIHKLSHIHTYLNVNIFTHTHLLLHSAHNHSGITIESKAKQGQIQRRKKIDSIVVFQLSVSCYLSHNF